MEEASLLLVGAQLTPPPQDFSSLPRVSEVFTPIAQQNHKKQETKTKKKSMTPLLTTCKNSSNAHIHLHNTCKLHNMKISQENYIKKEKKLKWINNQPSSKLWQ